MTHAAALPEPVPPPKRILIHAINYPPEMIGCGKYTGELAEYLAGQGHAVEVVTAPPHYPGWSVAPPYKFWRYQTETRNGVRVVRCPILARRNGAGIWRLLAPLSWALAAAPVVLWRAWRFKPDAILCVEPTLFSAPAALLAAKLVGARAVLHVQDLEVDAAFAVGHVRGGWLRRCATKAEGALLRGFDRVVTISGKMRDALAAKGVAADRLLILRNWLDLPVGDRRAAAAAYRAELGIAQDAFVALYSGHLGAKQALHEMLAAARLLAAEPTKVLFVIAGEGPLKEKLQASAADLGNVRFLPLQPAERMHDFLALADLHLLPQTSGAADLVLPSKLGPMLASGKPVAAMADPGTEVHEILRDAAVLVPVGKPAILADAVAECTKVYPSIKTANALSFAKTLRRERVLPQFSSMLFELLSDAPEKRGLLDTTSGTSPPLSKDSPERNAKWRN